MARIVLLLLTLSTLGCRFLGPVPITADQRNAAAELIETDRPQVEVGRPNKVIDTVGNVFGLPSKLLFWDLRIDNHRISDRTLMTLTDYLAFNDLPHVKVRANQYAPLDEWRRLRKNKTMSPAIRYTLGTLSVARYTLLPGRLLGGDNFNPYTQTINLYSDVPVIALHEGGHAKDHSRREYQGLYTLAYGILPLWHETIASEDVFAYLEASGDAQLLSEADRMLYPAYGTYVGNALGILSPANALPIYASGVVLGHINGRTLARQRSRESELSPPRVSTAESDLILQTSYEQPTSGSDSRQDFRP